MSEEREPVAAPEPARPAPHPAVPQAPAPPPATSGRGGGLTRLLALLALLAVVLIAAAFVAAWWPERQRRVAVEGELAAVRAQLEQAESRVRLAALLGDLMALTDALADRNYGQAQELSTRFFDAVRAELWRSAQAEEKDALEWVLGRRDAVTVALTRGDPAASDLLRRVQVRLRRLLGYPAVTPAPVPELPAARPLPVPRLSPPASPTPAAPAATPAPTPTPSPEPSEVTS